MLKGLNLGQKSCLQEHPMIDMQQCICNGLDAKQMRMHMMPIAQSIQAFAPPVGLVEHVPAPCLKLLANQGLQSGLYTTL